MKKLQSVSESLSSSAGRSLRCEGEDHPADDEVEEEDGVHDQGFAVRGLTVCQERCGCCGKRQILDKTASLRSTVDASNFELGSALELR